jgi:hypothetical protein
LDLETIETSDEKDDNNKTIKDPCETISSILSTCNAAIEFSYPRDKNGRLKAKNVIKEADPRVKRSILSDSIYHGIN